jgi:acetoacetyl-CoA synthetase
MADIVWTPSPQRIADAHITAYLNWLAAERGRMFVDYDELWQWSVTQIEEFWASIWDHFDVRATYEQVLPERHMPGAQWFPRARLNYAEHALRRGDTHPAIVFENESGHTETLTYEHLRQQVSRVATWLQSIGVVPGDRVVALLPNIPQTVVAFLATASIGATWSCCSPEFGVRSVVDRFAQIEPTVLIAVDGYIYGGTAFDRRDDVAQLRANLPTLRAVVTVGNLSGPIEGTTAWAEVIATAASGPQFTPVPFDNPLWILYSSGATGPPRPSCTATAACYSSNCARTPCISTLAPTTCSSGTAPPAGRCGT